MSSRNLILEGLSDINEAVKSKYFDMQLDNVDKSRLEDCSGFIKKLESFGKLVPKMDKNFKMAVDVTEFVGRGLTFTIYIYGYREMYDDEYTFNGLHTAKDMEEHIRNIARSVLGPYQSLTADTYWDAKIEVGRKRMNVGPYVEIVYGGDYIYDGTESGTDIDNPAQIAQDEGLLGDVSAHVTTTVTKNGKTNTYKSGVKRSKARSSSTTIVTRTTNI